ncbi:hypothetical protein BFW38_10705 [Terasakiispira papahanaumokuakeensis]|uniref:Uncharacterized protein n=1 Tax=Terasakiispira papahanaumokuakeensis TaxID=197479 RepID=A0A1E2VA90_9GAMM|nr:hypothetical protein [Terasakiispira papahanaumokuakeensis]ODC03939.1 hypothetical protein BFW38_10705 [Terasakiispira papahanaumokuakeensis]
MLVDELNDEIETEVYSDKEKLSIVLKLLMLLPNETDLSVHESILNLLSGVYPSGLGVREIDNYILGYIQGSNSGSLVHALSIVSESNLEEKKEILTSFLKSDISAIQNLAQNYLSEI